MCLLTRFIGSCDAMAYTRLTTEQSNIVKFATCGHNICILGRAGAGKTTVVQEIRSQLEKRGKKCQIVCSSGIACQVYNGLAKTVHSHYGLQTAELPQSLLLRRSLERNNIVEQVKNVHVLIWDEISMSSLRLLNIVNLLHQNIFGNTSPFGGTQVILVGDFWQLQPIKSRWDSGDEVYESKLFGEVFPHRCELTKNLRQDEAERKFKEALDVMRSGRCDEDTDRYFSGLSRELPFKADTKEEPTVHIYFKRLPVNVHNANSLAKLPGATLTFESIDSFDPGLCTHRAQVPRLNNGSNYSSLFS